MSKELDAHLYISGDPERARATLGELFTREKWRVEWNPDGWSGVAKKGNKGLNIAFGAFAQYHEVWFAFITMPDHNIHLRIYRSGSGIAGGLIGVSSVKKSFRNIVQQVEATYHNAGVLLSSAGQ